MNAAFIWKTKSRDTLGVNEAESASGVFLRQTLKSSDVSSDDLIPHPLTFITFPRRAGDIPMTLPVFGFPAAT